MVLVTLRGCHLLDSLWWSPSKHAKKIVLCSEEVFVGDCTYPTEAVKSNSSRARREARQVVRPGQVLELVVSTLRGTV